MTRFKVESWWQRPHDVHPVNYRLAGTAIELNDALAAELVSDWADLRAVEPDPAAHPRVLEKLALYMLRRFADNPQRTHGSILHRPDDFPAIELTTHDDPNQGSTVRLWMQNDKLCTRPEDGPNLQILWQGKPILEMWFDADQKQHRNSATKPAVIKYDHEGRPVLHKFWYQNKHWRTVEIIYPTVCRPTSNPTYRTMHYDRHVAHTILEDQRTPGCDLPVLRPLSARILMVNSDHPASAWASALECSVRVANSVAGLADGIGKRPDLIVIHDDVPLNGYGVGANKATIQASLRTHFGNNWDLSNQFLWGDNAPRSLALAWHLRHSQRLAAVPIMFMTGDSNLASLAGTPGLDSGVTIAQVGRQSVDAIKKALQDLLPRRYPVKAR